MFFCKKNALKGVVFVFICTVAFEFSLTFLKETNQKSLKLHDMI